MRLSKSIFAVVIALLAGTGCSVKTQTVANKPPVINRSLKKYTTEVGTITPQVISVFLWPDYSTEADVVDVVNQVNVKGQQLDEIFRKSVEADRSRKRLEAVFAEMSCLDYAERTRSRYGVDEWVTKWVVLEDDASDQEKQTLQACVDNQNEREPVMIWLTTEAAGPGEPKTDSFAQEFADVREAIYMLIDPGYTPENQQYVNRKDVETIGSSLVVSGNGVEIRFADFITPGFSPSTQAPEGEKEHIFNVSYSADTKLLKFSIQAPDVEGGVYEFSLERAPDLLGETMIGADQYDAYVRFLGDMKLKKDGVVLRHGSAKILGEIKQSI